MPTYSTAIEDKIIVLKGLYNLGTAIEVHELVEVAWSSDPADTVFYSTMQTDEQASSPPVDIDDNPISPIEVRLIADDDNSEWFVPVKSDSTVGDEEIDLELWDGDGDISDKLVAFGEGGRVTLHYWFPQVSLLLPWWAGHVEYGDGSDGITMKIKAAQGYRAADETTPDRGHVQYCQAVFGGLLGTQEEIDEHDCPYNLHLGGIIGINDPDTGLPWTFCDRLSIDSCVDRGVYSGGDPTKPWYHLSHRTIEATVSNGQTKGPRILETSHGNETGLDEPVCVIMGIRRKYGAPTINFRRDTNTRNPGDGFFQHENEFCEGPIVSFADTKVSIGGSDPIPIVPFHYGQRLGEKGQAPVTETLTPHSYSGTAHIRYTSGPLDPSDVDPGQVTAESLITGLRDIRVYHDAGNGLVGDYYRYEVFTERMGRRIDSQINFPTQNPPPVEGQFSENGFSVEWNAYISFRYLEATNFTTPTNDDHVQVWIENTDLGDTPIIDATYPSTGSGTYTPAAIDTPIPIRIRLTQAAAANPNPWGIVLKWQSTSQALEVVPNSRFFHDATYTLDFTRNRVWQLARILCDPRWGFGWDYNDLDIEAFKEAAVWCDKTVIFTDPFGKQWYHTRAVSDVELVGRKGQQQIEDMCTAGNLSLPFMFNGKLSIVPLRALTDEELAAAPVFTDVLGDNCNILYEDDPEMSTLRVKPISNYELKNQIKVSIDDIANNYLETPLRPFEDIDAQLAAGRARGTRARKINKQEYKLLGVTQEAQGTKMGWSILDRGPLDRGGLRNNLPVEFKTWFADAIDLHQGKVIKIVSPDKLTRYGFQYFRILEMERSEDLTYSIHCIAYNKTYMDAFETEIEIGDIPEDPPNDPFPDPPGPEPPPCVLGFDTITSTDNVINIPIFPCNG